MCQCDKETSQRHPKWIHRTLVQGSLKTDLEYNKS